MACSVLKGLAHGACTAWLIPVFADAKTIFPYMVAEIFLEPLVGICNLIIPVLYKYKAGHLIKNLLIVLF